MIQKSMTASLVNRISNGREEMVRINCIYFNNRGLTGKADELRTWIGTCDWNVITIAETGLREGQIWQLNVSGYKCYRQDRVGRKRGGYIALLIKRNVWTIIQDIIEGWSREAI